MNKRKRTSLWTERGRTRAPAQVPQADVVVNAREDGKDRGQQLDETSVVELKLVEAVPLSKYMAGPGV